MDSSEILREKAYRLVAYSSIGFAIVAVVTVAITLPMAYNYVNNVQEQLQRDLQFCEDSAHDLWNEAQSFAVAADSVTNNRQFGNRLQERVHREPVHPVAFEAQKVHQEDPGATARLECRDLRAKLENLENRHHRPLVPRH